jgi:hypothetical protein
MQSITKYNVKSMVALHVAWLDIFKWNDVMDNFTFIKSPLTIGCSKPTGYSTTWAHKPLGSQQAFFMFKLRTAHYPTHNAWTMYSANKKSNWRGLWTDLSVLKPKEFYKDKKEIRKRVHVHVSNACIETCIMKTARQTYA